ncbi:MAG: hypothetical protein AAB544_00910 [Patescibacteria group bacterium]
MKNLSSAWVLAAASLVGGGCERGNVPQVSPAQVDARIAEKSKAESFKMQQVITTQREFIPPREFFKKHAPSSGIRSIESVDADGTVHTAPEIVELTEDELKRQIDVLLQASVRDPKTGEEVSMFRGKYESLPPHLQEYVDLMEQHGNPQQKEFASSIQAEKAVE